MKGKCIYNYVMQSTHICTHLANFNRLGVLRGGEPHCMAFSHIIMLCNNYLVISRKQTPFSCHEIFFS